MNVESTYVRIADQSAVVSLVRSQLKLVERQTDSKEEAPLPSSYETILRTDPKRKVLVSPPSNGWITVLESKEVVDFWLAKRLSEELDTTVVVVQIADGVGARGVAVYDNGAVVRSDYSEDDDDPWGTVRLTMTTNGIDGQVLMFKEAIAFRSQGWEVVSR